MVPLDFKIGIAAGFGLIALGVIFSPEIIEWQEESGLHAKPVSSEGTCIEDQNGACISAERVEIHLEQNLLVICQRRSPE